MDEFNVSQRDIYEECCESPQGDTLVQVSALVEAAMRAISYSEARDNLASVLDGVVNDAEVTVVRRAEDPQGKRSVYLVPASVWESMEETAYLMSGRNREHILRGLDDLKSGNVREHPLLDDDD